MKNALMFSLILLNYSQVCCLLMDMKKPLSSHNYTLKFSGCANPDLNHSVTHFKSKAGDQILTWRFK